VAMKVLKPTERTSSISRPSSKTSKHSPTISGGRRQPYRPHRLRERSGRFFASGERTGSIASLRLSFRRRPNWV
jgi:hypothetical protein